MGKDIEQEETPINREQAERMETGGSHGADSGYYKNSFFEVVEKLIF